MRAFAVLGFGDAPAVHDLPVPAAGNAFLLRVTYAGVNPLDNNNLARLTASSAYPYVLGIDFAGVVERIPAGEDALRAGDRVFGMARTHGAWAEYTAVTPGAKAEPLAPIPDGVTDEQAAALPTAAVTALRTVELLGVTAGQRLVVMGATGGVGGYAVQMALSRGAYVIATVRGDAEFIKPGGRLVSTIFAADEKWFAGRQITAHNSAQILDKLRNGGLRGKAVIRL
jgi:NADPH2:quinone reductase